MKCVKCKNVIPDDAVYCQHCGKKQIAVKRTKTRRINGTGSVYQLPDGKWVAQAVLGYETLDDGKLRRIQRTKYGFKTKKEAELYLPNLYTQQITVKPNITFKGLFDEWYPKHAETVSKSTMSSYNSAFKYYESIWYMKVVDIKTKALQACIDACPYGKRTKENMKAVGTMLFRYAMQNDLVSKNYAEYIQFVHEASKRHEHFTLQERNTMWKMVDKVPDIKYVLCMMYLGFRTNEFLKVKVSDVHDGYIIGGSKTQAGINRIVTISPKIQDFIEKFKQAAIASGCEYLFSKNGKKITDKKYCLLHYGAIAACGIPKKEPYCCRHTFATMMKLVNAPDADKMELIGHANIEMTNHYTHSEIDDLKKITDKLA